MIKKTIPFLLLTTTAGTAAQICLGAQSAVNGSEAKSVQLLLTPTALQVPRGGLFAEQLAVTYTGKDYVRLPIADPLVDNTITVTDPQGKVMSVSVSGAKYLQSAKENFNARVLLKLRPGYATTKIPLIIERIYDFSELGVYKVTVSNDYTVGPDNHTEHDVSNTAAIEIIAPKAAKPIVTK